MSPFWKNLVIYSTPLMLGLLEIYHPVWSMNQTIYEGILPQLDLWLDIHLLQVPLFGLMALAVLLLIGNLEGLAVTVSRIGIGCFVCFYIALDSIAGISSGILIQQAQDLPVNIQKIVAQQVHLFFVDPMVGGGTFSLFYLLGGGGWLVGVIMAAIALARVGVDRLTVIFLILAGVLFALSHAPPTGPLGMMFFFLAVVRIDPHVWNKTKQIRTNLEE